MTTQMLMWQFIRCSKLILSLLLIPLFSESSLSAKAAMTMRIEQRKPPERSGQPSSKDVIDAVRDGQWHVVRRFIMLGAQKPTSLSNKEESRWNNENISIELIDAASIGDIKAVRRLLSLGADPNTFVKLDDCLSPLARASRSNHVDIVKILIAHGARVNETLEYSMGHGWFKKSTALIWACRENAFDSVRELLTSKANVEAQEIYHPENDPIVIIKGDVPITACDDPRILKILLKFGANPDHCGSDGFTALMKYSAMGKLDQVKLLLRFGAKPELKNSEGYTAEDIAVKQGHLQVAAFLKLNHKSNS